MLAELVIGVALLAGMIAWQVQAVIRSDYPGIPSATSPPADIARLVVTARMLLNLGGGLGNQVLLGAVERGKANANTET